MVNELIELYQDLTVHPKEKIIPTITGALNLLVERRDIIEKDEQYNNWAELMPDVVAGKTSVFPFNTRSGLCAFLSWFNDILIARSGIEPRFVVDEYTLERALRCFYMEYPDSTERRDYPVRGRELEGLHGVDLAAGHIFHQYRNESRNMFGPSMYGQDRWDMIIWLHKQTQELSEAVLKDIILCEI